MDASIEKRWWEFGITVWLVLTLVSAVAVPVLTWFGYYSYWIVALALVCMVAALPLMEGFVVIAIIMMFCLAEQWDKL